MVGCLEEGLKRGGGVSLHTINPYSPSRRSLYQKRLPREPLTHTRPEPQKSLRLPRQPAPSLPTAQPTPPAPILIDPSEHNEHSLKEIFTVATVPPTYPTHHQQLPMAAEGLVMGKKEGRRKKGKRVVHILASNTTGEMARVLRSQKRAVCELA